MVWFGLVLLLLMVRLFFLPHSLLVSEGDRDPKGVVNP